MSKKIFNPLDWLDPESEPKAKCAKLPKYAIAQTAQNPVTPDNPDLLDDIETITSRIEQGGIDIAPDYASWRDLGFALADAFGEHGRNYYHRLSRFYSGYSKSEADKQYDSCLRSRGSGVTIRSFFQMAKSHGINIATKVRNYAKCAECATAQKEGIAQNDAVGEQLPTFSDKIVTQLPDFLSRIYAVANSTQDADVLILGTITVISACLPHVYGVYDGRKVFPNLFLFVTARASSGKGRLGLCRYIVEPIHRQLRNLNEAEIIEYRRKLAEYNAAGKKKVDMEKPEEPPMRMLFIPANSSATAVYQVLNDNGGRGLMFETEGDTLANTFASDYGNYSDGFRKAFHHETISYIRRKDRKYVDISKPQLSTLLTGTPRQIQHLITDAENGLFSRFIFYHLNIKTVWNDVFRQEDTLMLDEYFQELGQCFYDYYKVLEYNADIRFYLTPEQRTNFNEIFADYQESYCADDKDEFIATVRRLGLITFRIAMILTLVRAMESSLPEERIICSDEDYNTAMVILKTLIEHSNDIFSRLPQAAPALITSTSPLGSLKQQFLDSLPSTFDRPTYQKLASELGLNLRSVDRNIRQWVEEGKLKKLSQGKYMKG